MDLCWDIASLQALVMMYDDGSSHHKSAFEELNGRSDQTY